MKQEVVEDFLNLPGIAGVALMDGRSRPFFCGVDEALNFQQKEALAQGILRVVETIPEGFETFEFQFIGHQVYIYKLENGLVLLVLTRSSLIYPDYLETIKNLKAVLKADISNAIATFRLMAGNITLSGLGNDRGTAPSIAAPAQKSQADADVQAMVAAQPNASDDPRPTESTLAPDATTGNSSLKELLPVLNHLSKFTTEYLGTHVIVNYWKSSRPSHEWLSHFQIDRSAQFTFTGATSLETCLTASETQWVHEWVAAFIKRCSQVIRDFPNLVEQKALSQEQKKLLLG